MTPPFEFECAAAARAPRPAQAHAYQPLDGLVRALERLEALARDLAADADRERASEQRQPAPALV